jgi:hypothetical protein
MDSDSDTPLLYNSESCEQEQDIEVKFIYPGNCPGTLRFEDDELLVRYKDNDITLQISYYKILKWMHSTKLWGIEYKDSYNKIRNIKLEYEEPDYLNKKIKEKISYFINL